MQHRVAGCIVPITPQRKECVWMHSCACLQEAFRVLSGFEWEFVSNISLKAFYTGHLPQTWTQRPSGTVTPPHKHTHTQTLILHWTQMFSTLQTKGCLSDMPMHNVSYCKKQWLDNPFNLWQINTQILTFLLITTEFIQNPYSNTERWKKDSKNGEQEQWSQNLENLLFKKKENGKKANKRVKETNITCKKKA